MTLTNYLWILYWGIICAFLYFFSPTVYRNEYGKKVERCNIVTCMLMFFPYVIWAARRPLTFGDTDAYSKMYISAPSALGEIFNFASEQGKDKGFYYLMAGFKSVFHSDYIAFFLLIAAVQILCLIYVYQKYSPNFWLSMFCFVMVDYLSYMHNGIRQFIAVSILFACFPLLVEKKYWQLVLITLLVSTIHMTALLYIPFIFIVQGKAWNNKTVLFILVVLTAVLFLDRFTGLIATAMESTQYSYEVTDFLQDDGVSLMRVLFCSIPTIIALLFRRNIEYEKDPVLNICVNMSIVTTGFYIIGYFTSGIYAGRIPIFFSL